MKEVKNDIIKKYEYKDYVVYVKVNEEDGFYDYYLQNEKEQYGIISLMFGVPTSDIENIEEIIENNIEDYIKLYKEDYED